MLLSKKLLGTVALTGILFSVSTKEVSAKRYIPAKDDEVEYTLNRGRAQSYAINKEKIKVLVWNLYKGDKPSFATDFRALSQGKDILLLQEVITDTRMKTVIALDAGRTYHVATSFFDTDKDWARSGTATASKYRPLEVKWQRSRYNEPVLKTPKMISIAKFDVAATDRDLLTLSIHGVNFVGVDKLKDQVVQAAKLIATHRGPVIFGGDFNTWSDGKLDVMRSTLKAVGMKEVPFEKGRMETLGKPLDHVWIKGLKLHSSKVYKDIEGSDHKALEVEVSFDENL